jgi:hypothetical protein
LIQNARQVEVTNATALEICIPNYSDNITGAKEFVKFFYSDAGLKIWAEKTQILGLAQFDNPATKIDTTKFSAFAKSQYEFAKKARPVSEGSTKARHDIFVSGGASLVAGFDNGGYAAAMTSQPSKNGATIWASIKENLTKNWATYWANAGLDVPKA